VDSHTLICSFKEAPSLPWQHVRGKDMVKAVQHAVEALGLLENGYNIKTISSHSLHAGRATALYINEKDALTIQHAGRWMGTTKKLSILSVISLSLMRTKKTHTGSV